MVQRQHLRKTAVLVSSVLLVCALIAYRANAFNLRSMLGGGDSEGTVMSGTKAMTPENFITGSTPSDPPPAKAEQPPPESPGDIRSRRYEPILGGSKSAPVFQNLPATEKPVRPK